jgi:hypothetical protein
MWIPTKYGHVWPCAAMYVPAGMIDAAKNEFNGELKDIMKVDLRKEILIQIL